MKIRDYLKKKRLTQVEFAAAIKASQSLVSAISRGEKKPSGRMAIRIVEATKGMVSFEDLYLP